MKNLVNIFPNGRIVLLLVLLLCGSVRAWALKPDRVYKLTPDSLGLAYTAKDLTTADGFAIKTWTIAPAAANNKRTTVVLAYQDFGNMSYYLYQASALSRAGYQVVTFDYRGFGQSADFALNLNQLYYQEFAEDLRTVVKATRQQFPQQKLGVYSLSMGTIVATLVGAEGRLDFLVGEGFVTEPKAFVDRVAQAKNKQITLPAQASQYAAQLAKVKCPLLVFAGRQDNFTTLADSQKLVASNRRRELVAFEGGHLGGIQALAGPGETVQQYGDGYVRRITEFLRTQGQL
jgi:predicted alpha/beta hydrolase